MRPEIDCCWKCGYDLSRVAGDYVRCSECGEVNNRLTAARDLARWRVRRWTRWVVGGFAAMAAVAVWYFAAFALLWMLALVQSVMWVTYAGGCVVAMVVLHQIVWAMTPGERRHGQLPLIIGLSIFLGVILALITVWVLWLMFMYVALRLAG